MCVLACVHLLAYFPPGCLAGSRNRLLERDTSTPLVGCLLSWYIEPSSGPDLRGRGVKHRRITQNVSRTYLEQSNTLFQTHCTNLYETFPRSPVSSESSKSAKLVSGLLHARVLVSAHVCTLGQALLARHHPHKHAHGLLPRSHTLLPPPSSPCESAIPSMLPFIHAQ